MVLSLTGTVASGRGEGKEFLDLDWVRHQIREKLGFDAYRGTLNVQLNAEASQALHTFTTHRQGTSITPIDTTFASGKAFRVQLNGRVEGALVIPLVPHYPPNQLEIIAPINLRDALALKDGDEVTVEIYDT